MFAHPVQVGCVIAVCCFLHYSVKIAGKDGELLLDYSKNIITEKTLQLLFQLVSFVC